MQKWYGKQWRLLYLSVCTSTYDGRVVDGGEHLRNVGQDGLGVREAHCGVPVALARRAAQHHVVHVGDDVARAEEPDVLQPRCSGDTTNHKWKNNENENESNTWETALTLREVLGLG